MKLDIVLYGATGFTGKLACQYIFETYGAKLNWGIAGRSASKLEALAKEFGGPAVLVADADDEAALDALVCSTKVVVTFAGPFARYGTKLVAACAAAGTDYCDITGEISWVQDMIHEYDAVARASGARIVPLCGHDSVPWDLTTLVLANKIRENGGEELARVDLHDRIRSAPSGGTVQTAVDLMDGKCPSKPRAFDPLLRTATGEKSGFKTAIANVAPLAPRTEADGAVRGFFVMSDCNARTVRRSNALNGYGSEVTYCEGRAFSSLAKARKADRQLLLLYAMLKVPCLRSIALQRGWLSQPGEGPSADEMAKGFLEVRGEARGVHGSTASAVLTYPTDPGYKDTARMAVEAGLALALEGGRVGAWGGVLTPASCQGEVLLQRLLKTGCTLKIAGGDAKPRAAPSA